MFQVWTLSRSTRQKKRKRKWTSNLSWEITHAVCSEVYPDVHHHWCHDPVVTVGKEIINRKYVLVINRFHTLIKNIFLFSTHVSGENAQCCVTLTTVTFDEKEHLTCFCQSLYTYCTRTPVFNSITCPTRQWTPTKHCCQRTIL